VTRALFWVGTALTATALALSSCDSPAPDTPGRVVAKDREWDCDTTGTGRKARSSCGWEYGLTTRDSDGQEHEFAVSGSAYDDCHRGSRYPACTDR
jgi:hypothetical protein